MRKGIVAAYPTDDELWILLSEEMDLIPSSITRGNNYTSKVAYLVEELDADGRIEELIRVVVKKKPNSPHLVEIITKFRDILEPNIEYPSGPVPLDSPFYVESPPLEPIIEYPDRPVALDSRFYVERPPIESDCYNAILQPGALIRVEAPRKMGKTSLMVRILDHAETKGNHKVVLLDFLLVDKECLSNLDRFLQWFCANIAEELKINANPNWKPSLGSKSNCKNYFRDYILSSSDSQITLGLDNVDRIFQNFNIAQDFFSMLRAWYEKSRSSNDIWRKFHLIIVYSTKYPELPKNQSPFNVGTEIKLPPLDCAQVGELVQRHNLRNIDDRLENLMEMFGGHPYLIRLALYKLATKTSSLEELLKIDYAIESYRDDLKILFRDLRKNQDLVDAFKRVVCASDAISIKSEEASTKLKAMGLVTLDGE